jgi:cell wall assembly regulator SMI1
MSIKIGSTDAAEEADIRFIEQAVGLFLPNELKQFFRKHDGVEPEDNTFDIESSNDSGVNRFIPARQILSEHKKVGLSPTTIPIAWAEGGNLVLMDVRLGSVLFWDHETDDETKLANSLAEFLEALQPFNIDDIELKPGQVKRVWVDPKLLEELEEEEEEE